MRKLLVGLLCGASLLVAAPVQATPVVNGSFVSSEIRHGQAHRVYFTVTAGHGAKQCDVTLRHKTDDVALGTDKTGDGVIFFVRARNATKALAQAQADTSPTTDIVCSH